MQGRAALVTGGSSGIGLAIARALGEDGYAITLSARRAEKLEQAAEALRADGIDVAAVAADMAEEQDILDLVAAHRDRHGRLDVLVNSAGIGIGGPIAEQPTRKLDLQIAVNLRAVFIATRECLPLLKEAGAEHRKALIVNVSSISGKYGQGWLAAYSATKAGVIGLTQALHKEHSTDGIQATALCPGWVDTAMTDFIKEAVPADQMIRPEDIAGAVRYLLSTSPNCVVPEIQFVRPGETL